MHTIGLIRAYGGVKLCKHYEYRCPAFVPNAEAGAWPDAAALNDGFNNDSGYWHAGAAVGRGVSFHGYREEPVNDLTGLRDLLRQLETQRDVSLVQGQLKADAHFQVDGQWRDAMRRTKDLYQDIASNILVLDIDNGVGDDAGDVLRGVRDVLDMVDELNGCAYVGQLSSSRGIKSGLRVRVFIETTKPLTLEQQHAWVKSHPNLFDDSIYVPGHIIASAAPLLTAQVMDSTVAVTRPVRGDTVWLEPGCKADIEPIDVRALARAAGVDLSVLDMIAANADTRDNSTRISTDNLLQQLSPGHINEPLNRLICSAAWSAPEDKQDEAQRELYARVMNRLAEISQGDNRFDERKRTHMRPADWQKRWQSARQRRAQHYAAQLAQSTAIVPAITAAPAADTRAPRQILCDEIADAATQILEHGNNMQLMVISPPGSGKSFGIRNTITPSSLLRHCVRIFVPTHELAKQLCDDLKGYVATLTPDGTWFGVTLSERIRHHKGRTRPGMCINETHGAMAERAEQAGLGARNSVCKNCPSRARCPWFTQADDKIEGIIIEAHQTLVSRGRQKDDWAGLYIIDEAVFGTVLQPPNKAIAFDALTTINGATRANKQLAKDRAELVKVLRRGLAPKREWGRVPVPQLANIDALLEGESRHREILQNNIMSTIPKRLPDLLDAYRASCVATSCYENIRDSQGKHNVFGVRVHTRRWREKKNAKYEHLVVSMRRHRLPDRLLEVGAIWLDGTAALDGDLSVWRTIVSPDGTDFAHKVIDAAPPVSPHVQITQLVDSSYAKSALSKDDDPLTETRIEEIEDLLGASWQLVTTAASDAEAEALKGAMQQTKQQLTQQRARRRVRNDSRLHGVWRTALQKAHLQRGKTVLLVAQKSIIKALQNMGLPDNVKTAHFNATRGLNHFKDVPAAIVVGRPALDNVTLELFCEALHIDQVACTHIESAEAWCVGKASLSLSDGTTQETLCEAHPDGRAVRLQKMISHAEVVQAVARVRPFDRTASTACDLTYMGRWPLVGMPVNRVTDLQSILPEVPDVALAGGFLSENFDDLRRVWPELTRLTDRGGIFPDGEKIRFCKALINNTKAAFSHQLCLNVVTLYKSLIYAHEENASQTCNYVQSQLMRKKCVEFVPESGQRVSSTAARLAIVDEDCTPEHVVRQYGVRVRRWRELSPRQVADAVAVRVAQAISAHAAANPWAVNEARAALSDWDAAEAYCATWLGVELGLADAKL